MFPMTPLVSLRRLKLLVWLCAVVVLTAALAVTTGHDGPQLPAVLAAVWILFATPVSVLPRRRSNPGHEQPVSLQALVAFRGPPHLLVLA
jgi:hypothetical protein